MTGEKQVSCPALSLFRKAASVLCRGVRAVISIAKPFVIINAVLFSLTAGATLPLGSVSSAIHNNLHPSDKKELIVITSSILETEGRQSDYKDYKFLYPNAHIILGRQIDSVSRVVNELCREVKERGTLDTVRLSAHGNSNSIWLNKDDRTELRELLRAIEKAQKKMGKKISKEYVFDACNIFTNFTQKDIAFYSKASKRLDACIVGPVNTWMGKTISYPLFIYRVNIPCYFPDARYCSFSPDGKITEDPRSSTSLVRRFSSPRPDDEDSSWFDRATAPVAKAEGGREQTSLRTVSPPRGSRSNLPFHGNG